MQKISITVHFLFCSFFGVSFTAEQMTGKYVNHTPNIVSLSQADIMALPNQTFTYACVHDNPAEGLLVHLNKNGLQLDSVTMRPSQIEEIRQDQYQLSMATVAFHISPATKSPREKELVINFRGAIFKPITSDPLIFNSVFFGTPRLTCLAPETCPSFLQSLVAEFHTAGEFINVVDGIIDFKNHGTKGLNEKGLLFLAIKSLQLTFRK